MKKTNNIFYCFSPLVMISTFAIEVILVMYILLFRQMNKSARIGVLLISCLAIFQLVEYSVCETLGAHASTTSKLGFVSITFLPPLGLHLVLSIAKKKRKLLVLSGYAGAVTWSLVFVLGDIMTGSMCKANYVIFNISEPYEGFYYLYYNFLVLLAMGLALIYAQKKNKAPRKVRKALYILVAGYAAFIVPSIFFTLIEDYKGTDSPLPSVMCGFAVTLALLLAFGTIPLVSSRKKR